MPTPDSIQGIDLPTFGDAPAIPTHLADVWYAAIARGIPRFANETQMNTAYPTPDDGQFAYVDSTKGIYVGIDGAWELHDRTVPLPNPVSVYVPTSQTITADSPSALPTPVGTSLELPYPALVRVSLIATFGTGITAASTVYGMQATLSGSGAGVTISPDTNVRCLSGMTSPINCPGTLTRMVRTTAAGTLTMAAFAHRVTPTAGNTTIRGVELSMTPLRWI